MDCLRPSFCFSPWGIIPDPILDVAAGVYALCTYESWDRTSVKEARDDVARLLRVAMRMTIAAGIYFAFASVSVTASPLVSGAVLVAGALVSPRSMIYLAKCALIHFGGTSLIKAAALASLRYFGYGTAATLASYCLTRHTFTIFKAIRLPNIMDKPINQASHWLARRLVRPD